mmetsp:Transcript_98799/g.235497  ORF Transcript_98799/g.235497 Transcript_98799/m.235497 type:complete len:606 (-) Transcript_98799:60-1877(-)
MQKGWGGKGAAAPIIPPAATFKGVPPAFKARQSWPQPMPQQQWQVPQAQAQWQKDPWKKEPWQKEDQGPPTVYPLQLLQESQLTTQGFPPEAPALVHDKAMTVFSAGHSILQELVGDIGSEVEIHHDPDWDIFPEVGEAIKNAGAEQLCFSVATCPNQGKWAVGIANGWKGRETASKLALSFALLAERPPPDLEDFCKNHPEFRAMVAEAGLLPSGPPKRSAPVGKGNSWPHVPAAHAAPVPHAPHAPAHAPPQSFAGGFPPFVWATLDASAGLVQDGLPPEGLCVYHDKQSSDLFRSGQSILQEVLGDASGEVIYTHDPDWDVMPEMAEAIRSAGGEDNCYAVATLPSHGIWAVGLAGGWKPREAACKLALSVALVTVSGDLDRFAQSYPDFVSFCQVAGTPGAQEPVAKKQRVAEPAAKKVPPAKGGGSIPSSQGKGKKGGLFGAANKFQKPLPRDTPLWVQLPQEQLAPEILQELSSDAVAVATDRPNAPVYQGIDAVLKDLVANPEEEILFYDDETWEQFPEVGQALKSHATMEEPLQLAICNTLSCWGVGVGRQPEARLAAAKLAVASMIALKVAEAGEVPDLSAHPDFSDFVGSVQPPI